MNYRTKKTRERSARIVLEAMDVGAVKGHKGQYGAEEAIWSSIHDHKFYMAEHAEICKGKLQGEFGYHAMRKVAEEVLEDTYEYTDGSN